MLRLKPSELTLTSDDIEETFRRMAHRRAHAAAPNHHARSPMQSGRPILRRGPQRSMREAMRTLGDIPILRPQPHQTFHVPVEEDDEDHDTYEPLLSRGRQRIDSVVGVTTTSYTHQQHTSPTPSAASSISRSMQLPLRPARSHEESSIQASSDVQVLEDMVVPLDPMSGYPVFGRSRTNTSDEADKAPSQYGSTTPTSGPAELRGGGGRPNRSRLHPPSGRHAPVVTSSPPQHEASCPDPTDGHPNVENGMKIRHLKGYFTGTKWLDYDFVESHSLPHTEPRRPSERYPVPTRSRSSDSVPAFSLLRQRPEPSESSADDVFGGIAAPEPPSRLGGRVSHTSHTSDARNPYSLSGSRAAARSTRFDSGASSASLAYSYYELPGSRQSSGEQGQYVQSQYDGTAAVRTSNQGAYFSIPASQVRAPDSVPIPLPSCPSSHPAAATQHSISPLPAIPYARATRAATGSFNTTDVYGQYLDATTAAGRDLPSPLDQFQEHFRQLARAQNTRRAVSGQVNVPQHPVGNPDTNWTRRGVSGVVGQRYYTEDNPQMQRWSSHHLPQAPVPYATLRYPEHLSSPIVNPTRRSTPETRANHRSSELDLAGRSPHDLRAQTHESAYERLQTAIQAIQQTSARSSHQPGPSRFSMPQGTAAREVPNQSRMHSMHQHAAHRDPSHNYYDGTGLSSSPSYNPYTGTEPSSTPPQLQNYAHPEAPRTSPSFPPRLPSRHTSTQHPAEPSHRNNPTRPHHLAPPPHYRDLPSTSLTFDHGSGTTSRWSPLIRAATSSARPHRPRVSLLQMNQENEGEAEVQMMRLEQSAFEARFGEGAQMHVMDETPPRVGRVERFMG